MYATISELLWTAPEFLRMDNPPLEGSQSGDIYSFSIIVSEILSRDLAFASHNKIPTGYFSFMYLLRVEQGL